MKRIISVLLAAALVLSSVCCCFAATQNSVLKTLKLLGIMVGDASGDMMLDQNLTRAQYAKMLIVASGEDELSENGTGFSLFKDVSKTYWAGSYIYKAAKNGWLIGYTDNTFRPDNKVKLEEVCAGVIRLLGYKASDLSGSFPDSYLNKADELGLLDDVDSKRGDYITRKDCAYVFYNALLATNASGRVYGETLGCTVVNGEISYTRPADVSKDGFYYGVVVSTSKSASASSNTGVKTDVVIYCTDGTQKSFTVDSSVSADAGKLIQIAISSGSAKLTTLSSRSLSGKINSKGTSLGEYSLSDDIEIMDVDKYGNAITVGIDDIAGLSLSSDQIKYYGLNSAGKIERLILNDATGKLWSYVYMSSVQTSDTNGATMNLSGTYTYVQNGQTKTVRTNDKTFSVEEGGALIKFSPSGEAQSMKNMTSVKIDSLTTKEAMYRNTKYKVSDDVQVYVRSDGQYYQTDIEEINSDDFTRTAWYTKLGTENVIEIIIAVKQIPVDSTED